jgi:hypothetical protein
MVKTLDLILLICDWATIVCGLLGACTWIKASTARVTHQDDRYYVGGDMRGNYKGQPIWVNSTSMKQSALNKNAAIFTGLAVLSQALAALLSRCS